MRSAECSPERTCMICSGTRDMRNEIGPTLAANAFQFQRIKRRHHDLPSSTNHENGGWHRVVFRAADGESQGAGPPRAIGAAGRAARFGPGRLAGPTQISAPATANMAVSYYRFISCYSFHIMSRPLERGSLI